MDRDIALLIAGKLNTIKTATTALANNTSPSNPNRSVNPDTRIAVIPEDPETRRESVPNPKEEPEQEPEQEPELETETQPTTRKK